MESCDRCQCGNKKLKKAVGGLHPIPVKPSLFWQLGMDMIGPLPETPRGNKYVVTLTDYFSKWAEATPLPSKHAEGVARFIYSVSIHMSEQVTDNYKHNILCFVQVICRFGSPETLITDQGREFVNELSAELYAITNTDHRITSAYHPQVIITIQCIV